MAIRIRNIIVISKEWIEGFNEGESNFNVILFTNRPVVKKKNMEEFFEILDLKLNRPHLTPSGRENIKKITSSPNSTNRANWKKKN